MATFKGVLKKISGGLKKALMVVPPFVGGLSIIALLTSAITMGVTRDNAEKGFMKTKTYQSIVYEESKQLTEKYENKEISAGEYIKAVNEFGTSDYVRGIINRDIKSNERWQGMLKTADAALVATLCSVGTLAISAVCCAVWYAGPNVAERLDDSAYKDFEWQPPKKEEKKPEPVKEETKHDDISSDEQELGSLDDYLDGFRGRS